MNDISALIKWQGNGDSWEVPWEGRVTDCHLPMAASGLGPLHPVHIRSGLYRSSVQTIQLNNDVTWDLSTSGCTEATSNQSDHTWNFESWFLFRKQTAWFQPGSWGEQTAQTLCRTRVLCYDGPMGLMELWPHCKSRYIHTSDASFPLQLGIDRRCQLGQWDAESVPWGYQG